MKKSSLLFGLLMLVATNVWAVTTYTGAMDDRSGYPPIAGFTGQSNDWSGSGGPGKGFRLQWTVTGPDVNGHYTYDYQLIRGSASNKAFALFDIETGDDFSPSDIYSWEVVSATDRNGNPIVGSITLGPVGYPYTFDATHTFVYPPYDDDLSNTELCQYSGVPTSEGAVPHQFYGLRWLFPGTGHNTYQACAWEIELVSDKAPMWGKFFGWGDQTTQTPYTYANFLNDNIDSSSRPSGAGNYSPTGPDEGWILVPGN